MRAAAVGLGKGYIPARPPLEPPMRSLRLALAAAIVVSGNLAAQRSRPVPRYTIEQFMNTTTMFGASFSPDGRSILVTGNQSGV